ncbi:hypothetical protein V8C37DRAFT_383316 [Trichoderma ceciliae]
MHRLQHLIRLLGRVRYHFRNHDQKKAAILQLPLDIISLVIDNLDLHDKFLLSHTCKAFRQITTSQGWDMKISRLPFNDRFGFLVGLAYTLPSHWACPKCCKLHRINTLDTPTAFNKPGSQMAMRKSCVPCGVDLTRRIKVGAYSIQHYHIQFALKLSRLGNIYHRQYLAKLMDTYTYTRTLTYAPFTQYYTAEPRIIDQQFFLRQEWNINKKENTALPLFRDYGIYFLHVCPHLSLHSAEVADSRNQKRQIAYIRVYYNIQHRRLGIKDARLDYMTLFNELTLVEDGIAMALETPDQWIYNSCLRCATDFGIIASTDKQKVTIQAWHNFGTEGSPMDMSWRANVADVVNYFDEWFILSPYLDYTHGSTRKLWLDSDRAAAGIQARRRKCNLANAIRT